MRIMRTELLLLSFIFLYFILVSVNGKEVTLHEPLINDFPPIKLTPNNKTLSRQINNNKCHCIFNFDSRDYPGEFFFHLHIPKTGGSTFAQCLVCWNSDLVYYSKRDGRVHVCAAVNMGLLHEQMQSGHKKIVSCEIQRLGHLPSFLWKLRTPKVRIITFIRHPFEHLFSAFMHMILGNPIANPCRNIRQIIEADTDPSVFQCSRYNLINMQTSAMSLSDDANIAEAISFVSKNVFHFGITGFYRPSLCLLAYQLGVLSLHAEVCDCSRISDTHVRHDNDHNKRENHSIASSAKILSDDDLMILESKYINLDRVLYDVSLRLFLERVMIAEKDEGISLLCAHTEGIGVVALKSTIREPHWYGIFEGDQ